MITREQIAQLLKSISEAHYQIHSYGWGDVPDLLAREDVIYPFLMVTPSSSTYEEGYATHTYTISIADRVLKDKANEVNVDSDTHQILLDILSQIDNLMYDDVDVVKGGTITPFFDNFRHEVTGHFADVGIRVKFAYDSCAVPSDIVPLPLPPPFECADATYRVQYENGTLIEEGTIASGGSKTINVPNPSVCDPASYEVRDADGNVLYSGTIASGGSENIVVTNSTVVVRKSDNTIISSVSVLAQGSANYQVADSVITLTDTDAATLSTTNVKATDPATIVAPNGTLNLNKSDGVLISGQVVKSGETKGYNVADSVITNDAVSPTYTQAVKATENLVLPPQAIEVNTVNAGSINSVGTIGINLTDGVNPVTPNSVNITGRTVTIDVATGGGTYDLDLVDRFGNAFPTKQVGANATWDLRTLTPFDWADLFLNTATGTYTTQEQNAIIDAVDSWFLAGIWQRRRIINLFTGKNAFDNSLNLCYPFDDDNAGKMLFVGSPTHDVNGVTFSSTSVGLIPQTIQTLLGKEDYNYFIYCRTNSAVVNGYDVLPSQSDGASLYGIELRNTSNETRGYFTSTAAIASNTDSRGGYHINGISGSNMSSVFKNGTSIANATLSLYSGLQQSHLNIGGRCNYRGASLTATTSRNYAGFALGKDLTSIQMQDDYTIWQQFQTDFNGRQV